MHPVRFEATATDGAARTGVAHTARGSYRTPCFMPVGTRGAIKYLSAADYERLGAEIVLGNTYHLMLRPGADTVAHFGGLGKFAAWGGLTLTDSGGFQVMSLGVGFRKVLAMDAAGVADDDGPATRNSARASGAVRPLRSVVPPPSSRQPPLRPWIE